MVNKGKASSWAEWKQIARSRLRKKRAAIEASERVLTLAEALQKRRGMKAGRAKLEGGGVYVEAGDSGKGGAQRLAGKKKLPPSSLYPGAPKGSKAGGQTTALRLVKRNEKVGSKRRQRSTEKREQKQPRSAYIESDGEARL